MQITEIVVYPVNEEKLKAYVTLTFDNCFVVQRPQSHQSAEGVFRGDAQQEAQRRHYPGHCASA